MEHESQLAEHSNATVLVRDGELTLERTEGNRYVVTDGWLTDWVIFYNHKAQWAQDGVLVFTDKIMNRLDRIAKAHAIDYYNTHSL